MGNCCQGDTQNKGGIAARLVAFVLDYCARHAHPVNAVLHLAGVPMAFFGVGMLVCGQVLIGLAFLAGGYLLQYLGHKAQGNEVGEVIALKKLYARLSRGGKSVV
jgi:hypothetical protein